MVSYIINRFYSVRLLSLFNTSRIFYNKLMENIRIYYLLDKLRKVKKLNKKFKKNIKLYVKGSLLQGVWQ